MEQIFDFSQADPLFVEAAKYVVETGKSSASTDTTRFSLACVRLMPTTDRWCCHPM